MAEKKFNSLAELASHFETLGAVATGRGRKKKYLEEAGQFLEDETKRMMGTYDLGFPALAPSTVARKGADTPLLEKGDLRESIHHRVVKNEVYVGSDDPRAVLFEMGTSRMPPRPFLSGAAALKEKEVVKILRKEALASVGLDPDEGRE